jgi:hypothetical protein
MYTENPRMKKVPCLWIGTDVIATEDPHEKCQLRSQETVKGLIRED